MSNIKDRCEYCGVSIEIEDTDFHICVDCGKTLDEDTNWINTPIQDSKNEVKE